jgi:heme-degrading monooxygenase HmoA
VVAEGALDNLDNQAENKHCQHFRCELRAEQSRRTFAPAHLAQEEVVMFAVLFELHPHPGKANAYFDYAKMLKPKLETMDGFIDNVRYRSLTRPGWILSVSDWRDEKAAVRWRTSGAHHGVSTKGRREIFADYHLRVGQVTTDSHVPAGSRLEEQRLDVTEVGEGTTVILVSPLTPFQDEALDDSAADETAKALGLDTSAAGLVSWDVFDGVFNPGNPILLRTWRDDKFAAASVPPHGTDARRRTIRIVRDYGMFDRRESPVFYPEVVRR